MCNDCIEVNSCKVIVVTCIVKLGNVVEPSGMRLDVIVVNGKVIIKLML